MPTDKQVDAQRKKVEKLREDVAQARIDRQAAEDARQNDAVFAALQAEEERLQQELAVEQETKKIAESDHEPPPEVPAVVSAPDVKEK